MRISRIYTTAELQVTAEICLDANACKYIKEVLRLKCGHSLILFNGDGFDYQAEIVALAKKKISVAIISKSQIDNESSLSVHLLQPLCRSEKMDWCLQKATELGVSEITPFLSNRVNINVPAERLAKKMHHWQAVVASACEQSGRAKLPVVNTPLKFNPAVQAIAHEATKVVAAPNGADKFSTMSTDNIKHCVCLIGPEGGLTTEEMLVLDNAGFSTISLGPRILRLETAVIATIALLQSHWGDLL